jgi:hypothetical protein
MHSPVWIKEAAHLIVAMDSFWVEVGKNSTRFYSWVQEVTLASWEWHNKATSSY